MSGTTATNKVYDATTAATATAGTATLAVEHLALLLRRQRLNLGPPRDRLLIHLARAGAQQQEVVGSAEALVLQQPHCASALALSEAPLHRQQLLHWRAEAARERGLLARHDALACFEHGLAALPAFLLELIRAGLLGIALAGAFFYSSDTRPIPEVIAHFAQHGEPVFHDCGLHSSPAHAGLADVQREYSPELLRRLVAYHYESAEAGKQIASAGLTLAHPGERFSLPAPLAPAEVAAMGVTGGGA